MILALCTMASAGMVRVQGEAMATTVMVQLADDRTAAADAAAVLDVFHAVELYANEWRPGSPIADVNAAAGGAPVAVPAPTWSLVERTLAISRLTGGAFDPSWAALWDLWDFHHPHLPDPDEVRARLPLVDHTRVELGPGTVRLPERGMRLGLGGVAKGWALGLAQQWLRDHGRGQFLLSAGGQVYAAGTNEDGQPWRVGVRDPDGGPEDSLVVLAVRDASVSTSGDYERSFVVDGVRYHHILDPRTGWPARGLRAVTTLAADALLADAASTAIFVAGPRGAAAMARTLGVEALWIDDNGLVSATRGLPVVWRR